MSYRPKHPLIVVVNADGSGYTLQFSTLAEAKTAYSSIVTDGVAYLYSSSKNSLSSGDGYAAIPEYNNGITYGTGALVRLNGVVYQLINFIGAGGYGPITHSYAWTTNVVIPPALPPISSTGSTDGARRGMTFTTAQNISFTPPACPSAGTILEEANTSSIIIPIYGQQIQVGTTVYNLVADGACDSYEVTTSVGYVPNGTLVASDETNNYFSNGDGGYYLEAKPPSPPTIVGYQGDEDHLITALFNVVNRTRTRAQYSDGSYGEWSEWNYTAYGTYYGNDDLNNYYSDGAGGFYSEAKPVCEDVGLHTGEAGWTYDGCHWSYSVPPQGTVVSSGGGSYEVDVGCGMMHLGSYTYDNIADGQGGTQEFNTGNYWENAGNLLGTCNGIRYYADGNGNYTTCEDENLHTNGVEGWTYDGCHWSYDDRWNCEDANAHTNGQDGWTYDGCHWSYVEPCPDFGTDLGYILDEAPETNGTPYTLGYQHQPAIADGYCGAWSGAGPITWLPSATQVGSDDLNNYYSDGAGSFYSEAKPVCEDSGLHENGVSGWTYDGCHWSYDDRWNCDPSDLHINEDGWTYDGCLWSYVEPCPSSGTTLSNDSGYNYVDVGCGNFAIGSFSTTTYADGNCGSYTYGGGSYYDSGTFIGNCNDYNYYSDGNGGYYQGEYTGPQCEDAGLHSGQDGWTYDGCHWSYVEPPPPCTEANTLLSESNMPSSVNVGCGDFTIGNNYDRVFADGACGTYNVTASDWVEFEFVIGYCNDLTYYSDGNGGYFSS